MARSYGDDARMAKVLKDARKCRFGCTRVVVTSVKEAAASESSWVCMPRKRELIPLFSRARFDTIPGATWVAHVLLSVPVVRHSNQRKGLPGAHLLALCSS